jgi:hypothetical protein
MHFAAAVLHQTQIAVGLFDLSGFIQFSGFAQLTAAAENGEIHSIKIPAALPHQPEKPGYPVVFRSIIGIDIIEQIRIHFGIISIKIITKNNPTVYNIAPENSKFQNIREKLSAFN